MKLVIRTHPYGPDQAVVEYLVKLHDRRMVQLLHDGYFAQNLRFLRMQQIADRGVVSRARQRLAAELVWRES